MFVFYYLSSHWVALFSISMHGRNKDLDWSCDWVISCLWTCTTSEKPLCPRAPQWVRVPCGHAAYLMSLFICFVTWPRDRGIFGEAFWGHGAASGPAMGELKFHDRAHMCASCTPWYLCCRYILIKNWKMVRRVWFQLGLILSLQHMYIWRHARCCMRVV